MRDQKGITLIALIITIIVMLILVVVSVTVALQTGLFDKAGEAARKTDAEMEKENSISSGIINVNNTESNIGDIVDQYTPGAGV